MMLFTKNGRRLVRGGLGWRWPFFLPGPLGRQGRDAIGDFLSGGRQLDSTRIDGLDLIEDEVGLICMQLADLESHDPPLAVGEYREREDRVHTECGNCVESILLTDQHRIIDAHLACVAAYCIAEIHGDADDFDS